MDSSSSPAESSHADHESFPISEQDRIPIHQRFFRSRTGLVLLMLFGILFGGVSYVYLAWPVLFLFFSGVIPHRYFRTYLDVSIGCWIYMKAYILEKLFGINVRIFGHQEKFADRCLIILNHRCHFDWLYFWMVAGKVGDSSKWQVMMKYVGKLAPFFGWTMQARNHFFLTRKWEVDKKELLWKLNYLKANDSAYQILIFPEGTDFNKKSKERSDTYAESNGLPKYEYVLHPKSTGFVYSLKTLREYKIDAIYDITVGYPDVLAKTEADMFVNRKIPREIHYHIKKFDAAAIPKGDEEIEEWLRCRWKEKEQRLKEFYTHREFRNLASDEDEKLNPGASVLHSNGYTNGHTHHSPAPHVLLRSTEVHSNMNFIRFFLSQLFYTGQGSFFLVLCCLHWTFIVWGILASIWLQYVSMKTDGMDYFIMKAHPDPEFIAQVTNNKTTSPK